MLSKIQIVLLSIMQAQNHKVDKLNADVKNMK